MVISRIERERDGSHGRLRLHLVGRAPVPRRRLRLAELYGRRRRLPVRRAARSGLLLGLAALEEEADGHEEDDEDDDGENDGPRDARLALLAGVAASLLAAARALVGRKHPVFGKVVEGMDVVSAIEGVPTDGRDKPIDAVRVETITIEE